MEAGDLGNARSAQILDVVHGIPGATGGYWGDPRRGHGVPRLRISNHFGLIRLPGTGSAGIVDATSQEDWAKGKESKAFKKEFSPQWFTKWVKDFYVLGGVVVYHGESD
jgi:hypothetical protein